MASEDTQQKIHELKEAVDALKGTIVDPAEHFKAHQLSNFLYLESRWLRAKDAGQHGVTWSDVVPIGGNYLKVYESLPEPSPEQTREMLQRLVVLKLNGGLGTTMGCSIPKNAIDIRPGVNFFDCFVEQIKALNEQYGVDIPLVLMNSFSTDDLTKDLVAKYEKTIRIYCIKQQMFPRIDESTLLPVAKSMVATENSEWYPPGHGDVYDTLLQSDIFADLKAEGREYLFCSNGDNLGATVDPRILNILHHDSQVQYCCEVVNKTLADVKGGTIIEYHGRLKLLETAEVPPEHMRDFTSIDKFSVFNTNNLWMRLDALRPNLDLDVIVNKKTVNGRKVIQLEMAMGAAISQFEHSLSVNCPRSRFAPVKKCSDLLLIMSDLYQLEHGTLVPHASRASSGMPDVNLDDRFYQKVNDFSARFAKGMPSLVGASSLQVTGDVNFGANVTLKGNVVFQVPDGARAQVPDNAVIENKRVTVAADGSLEFADL